MNDQANRGLVAIYTATGMLQAIVLQNILELTGIPVLLEYETYKYLPNVPSSLSGGVNLLVPMHFKKDALSLINTGTSRGETFGLLNHSFN